MQVKLNVIVGAVVAMCAVAASAQETVVKIGHVAPTSGPQAHYGKDNENGARMAVEDLNAKGVTVGGKKIKLELVAEDDAADPKQGAAVATKLCDSKVQGVVGHLNSGTTIPASKVYNDCGIPMITPSATNPKLTQQGYKNVFRLLANDNALGAGLALHAANNLKLKKVAIIDDRSAYGQGVAEVFKKTAMARGMTVVDEQYTNDKATDFTAILTAIKAKGPDAIFYGGMDATGGPMLKQARELGIKAVFSFGDGACTDEMAKLAGAAAEGLICSQAGLPASAASKGFNDAFKAKYGDVKQYAPFFYDAVGIMIAAMQKADSADPAKIVPEIAKISYSGATGKIEFDEKGDRKNAEITIFTLKGGKVEPIAVVQGGKSVSFEEFLKAAAPAPAAAPAAAAAPAPAPATPAAPAPAAPKK